MTKRLVCWFSCGATSAVATKLALDLYPDLEPHVVYCDTHSEHPDNARFLKDCEDWYGLEIERLESKDWKDIWDVFERRKYLVGPRWAWCTFYLKIELRKKYTQDSDYQVFGFDPSELRRVTTFSYNNPEINLITPLLDAQIYKEDCLQKLVRAQIKIPEMYWLGFNNNNCLGCPKGGQAYWNHIRKHFPEIFERMSQVEQKLNVAILKDRRNKQTKKLFLKDLDPEAGRGKMEPMSCGMFCGENE